MPKDIRSYFSPKTSNISTLQKDKSNIRSSSNKKCKRTFIESDSEDESILQIQQKANSAKTKKPKLNIKTTSKNNSSEECSPTATQANKKKINLNSGKRRSRNLVCISSSSDEDIPVIQNVQKPVQRKKTNVATTSKHLKSVNAADIFGNEPVKRLNAELPDILKKGKSHAKSTDNFKDDEFDSLILQANEVGDNWTTINNVPKKRKIENSENASHKDDGIKKINDNLSIQSDIVEQRSSSTSGYFSASDKISPGSSLDSQFSICDSQDSGIGNGFSPQEENLKLNSISNLKGNDSKVVSKKPKTRENDTKILSTVDKSDLCSKSPFDNKSEYTTSLDNKVEEMPSISSKHFYRGNKHNSKTYKSRKQTNSDANDIADLPSSSIVDEGKELKHVIEKPEIAETLLWVEKHKPLSSNKIIGQQGENSNVKKLINWLKNWEKNNSGNKKPGYVPGGWNKDPTGSQFKAAILCGPPGVGKTTSVSLVCKELGYDVVEFNASDTRSKRLLQEDVSELLTNKSLNPYFSSSDKSHSGVSNKQVLVMDEVDGMAGNEDRGGIQELIHLIKCTKIPIICMCNDRSSPKIRSLLNYCFELRFSRPRVEQMKGYMMSVCFKEKLNIPANILTDIITSTNNDVRLTLNHLSMLAADKSNTNLDSDKKNVKLGPWDVLRKVFSREDHKKMSIHDKTDLFFYDYSIAPLFVQENYLSVKPINEKLLSKQKIMDLFASAAESMCIGELVDKCIRSTNNWSLLPVQAIFSSYVPGEILEGYCTSQINFPSWFGQNSKQSKMNRLLNEIQIHTRLRVSGSKLAVKLDYAPHIRNSIIQPLVKEGTDGINTALEKLRYYDLLREDLDSLNEICTWSNTDNPLSKLDSKVKAAFTRAYNKVAPKCPYALTAPAKKIKASVDIEGFDELDDPADVDEDENDADGMIIEEKKKIIKKSAENDASTPSTSQKKSKPKKNTGQKKKK